MAYDEKLAARIRKVSHGRIALTEKKMFGGLTFMYKEKMLCGVEKDRLMVRVGPEQHDDLVKKPGAKVMDLTGKPMLGFLFVNDTGTHTDKQLTFWIDKAYIYVSSLPHKTRPKKRAKSKSKTK